MRDSQLTVLVPCCLRSLHHPLMMSLDWPYGIAESWLQHSALEVKSSLTTGTRVETIMTNDSIPSSQAGLRGPATFQITRVRFSCLLRCEIPSLAASSKLGENDPWYESVFRVQRRRISLSNWTPSAFSATAIGTSPVKELYLRKISPFFVTTYVFNLRPEWVDLDIKF